MLHRPDRPRCPGCGFPLPEEPKDCGYKTNGGVDAIGEIIRQRNNPELSAAIWHLIERKLEAFLEDFYREMEFPEDEPEEVSRPDQGEAFAGIPEEEHGDAWEG